MKYLIYHAFKMQNCKLLQTEFCLKKSKKLHLEVRIILSYSNSRCRKPAQKFGKYFDKQANTFWDYLFKGQLILKCLFGVFNFPKSSENNSTWGTNYGKVEFFHPFFGRNEDTKRHYKGIKRQFHKGFGSWYVAFKA